jgi:hypothetical protein
MKASTRSHLDGFAVVTTVLEHDQLTRRELLESLGEECGDPLVTPWKRGYNAAVRSAFGW